LHRLREYLISDRHLSILLAMDDRHGNDSLEVIGNPLEEQGRAKVNNGLETISKGPNAQAKLRRQLERVGALGHSVTRGHHKGGNSTQRMTHNSRVIVDLGEVRRGK
jgi:hypothetical protein